MPTQEPSPEDYLEIAEKVRSGEYFREARAMYDLEVHDPMTDRYWYIILTVVSLITMLIAFSALDSLYPLKKSVPFIFGTNDIVEDLPRMKSLRQHTGQGADEAIVNFLILNYVKAREEYNIESFDRNQNAVQTQSSSQVFDEYDRFIDPRNAKSPIVLYQRKISRTIRIVSMEAVENQAFSMSVIYEATLKGAGDNKPVRFQADIAFKYEPIKLDESTNKVEPYRFLVTGYRARQI